MPMTNIGQIAASAIEAGLAFMTGDTSISAKDGLRLMEALQGDLEAVLAEAKTKTIAGKARPAGDFLVVGSADEPSTWHLPVKVNGKPDSRLMGAAKAALGKGYRGNVYEGPDKAGATRKLKALYKAEDMPWAEVAVAEFGGDMMPEPTPFIPMTVMTFADMAAADEANETADNVRHLSRRFQMLFDNVMFSEEIDDKMGAVRGLVDELAALMGETPTVESEPPEASLGELYADGVAVEVARDATEADLSEAGIQAAIETGRRRPVLVDFGVMEPGAGNKRDNRYYPADVVRRDVHVFEGSTIFATDHKNKERNERTKVGKLMQCPTRFLENGTPVGRALIYDPYQAEKVRNRADAGALDTLACSIYGKGRAKKGKVDGKTYSIVEAITDGVYLELVSEAGAGGKALNLAESQTIGGEAMSDNEGKTKPAPADDTEVKEVEIQEDKGEAEPKADEVPVMLESEAIDAALAEVKLPEFVKAMLAVGQYADADALQEAVTDAIAEVKKMTGSGSVVGLGETEAPEAETLTVEEANKRHDERVSAVFAEVGI